MRREKQTSRDFYQHNETGEIFCIERRCDGVLIGSCGPLSEPLKDLDDYECNADIGGQEILLASVHLNANDFDEVKLPQVQQLLDFAGDRPAIMAGDFNARPNDPEIQRIVDTKRFAAKLDGPFTISSYDPHVTIDYIFVPRDWQLLEHRVIQTDLSNHLPVVATYRIP